MKSPSSAGLVLAMDIGTSSLRTALFSLDGRRIEATTSQQAYTLRTANDGTAELSPKDLLAAALRALTETFARQDADPRLRQRAIAGWGSSCFWHSLVGVDERFAAMTPIFTWADSRCALDAARLRRDFAEAETHARTGCMLRASFWPAKLAWLRRTQKPLLRRVAHWVSPVDYLHAQFTGRLCPSLSMTSGAGLLDLTERRWDSELTSAVGFTPTYEPGFAPSEPLVVTEKIARRFPRLKAAPLFPAIGDGAAGNLGSGATLRRVAAINYGTSAAARVVRTGEYRPTPFGIFCYAIEPERWLLGGATSNAGNAFHWASQVFRVEEKLLEASYRSDPHPNPGMTSLAFLNGERSPTWCEDLPAVLLGMRQCHTAVELHRAFCDATYLRLAQIVEPLERAAGAGRLRFIVSGGISHSPASIKRLVNALDRTCRISVEPEASLRGAAVFALERLGEAPAPAKQASDLKPDRLIAREFAQARRRQTLLEEGLRDLAARLHQAS